MKKEQLNQAKLIHAAKVREVGKLASSIAHEINNPLAFLSINLEMLLNYCKEKDKIEEMTQVIKECLEGIERIRIIGSDLSTLTSNASAHKSQIRVDALLDAVIRIAWNQIKDKVDIVKEYTVQTPVKVVPAQIGHIILNLLLNAHASIDQKGTVTVAASENDQWVSIKISDTGRGIASNELDKIFEPFFSTTQNLGIGLAVSKSILEEQGAKLTVESTPGQGSVFTVMIPKPHVM